MEALLSLDVGTTSTKAALFNLNGQELERAASPPYRTHSPHPYWAEQSAEEVWQAVLSVIRAITAQIDSSVHIRALCLAAQSGSLLPANNYGEPIYPLITWMDGRARAQTERWRTDNAHNRIKQISGWTLNPGLPLSTIAWLRQHKLDVFAAASRFFSLNDFIVYRLTGKAVTNPSNGSGMQLMEIDSGTWSDELCQLAGISSAQLSPIQAAGSVIGALLPAICQTTSMPADALLVNGSHDQVCTALALALNRSNAFALSGGTAWVITGVVDSLMAERAQREMDWNFFPEDGNYTISQSLGGLGASIDWWVNQTYRGAASLSKRAHMFAALDQELRGTDGDESLLFLPMSGGRAGLPASTANQGGFVNLGLNHSRADMARAILESNAFELRLTLESIQAEGVSIDQLWLVGGAAQSAHLPHIIADTIALPLKLPQYQHLPLLGAAILAGCGIHLWQLAEGAKRFRQPTEEVAPNAGNKAYYDRKFERYREHFNEIK